MRIARSYLAQSFAVLFSFAFLTWDAPPASAQATRATVVPAPPFIQTAGMGVHHAEQNAADPQTAHDALSGQELKWDSNKKTWVDGKTGQALGFDGVLASDGTLIPGPPFIYTPGIGLHEARQNKPADPNYSERSNARGPAAAYDAETSQTLRWSRSRNSWIDQSTNQALGFNGAVLNAAASATTALATSAGGSCALAKDSVVLKQLYDESDGNVVAAKQSLSRAAADRNADLAEAGLLDKSASGTRDADIAKAQHQQAQGLRDKLANAQANYDGAAKASVAAWQDYQNSLARLKDCAPAQPAESASGTGAPAPRVGSISGFAFVTADNAIVLGRSQAPPTGAHAAAGATASIGSTSAKTDGNGSFSLTNIPGGSGTLHVAASANPSGDFPVTIFGGATAHVGAPAITRAAALAAVTRASAAIAKDPKATIIIGPQEPLPAGTKVAPAYGDSNGDPQDALNHTASTEQWFIFLDPDATLRYQHPVEYFFVDAATGALTKMDETSWPLINGLGYYGNRDTVVKSPDLMVGPPVLSGPKPVANQIDLRARSGSSVSVLEFPAPNPQAHLVLASARAPFRQAAATPAGGTTYGLVIQGADESDETADITNIQTLFGRGGIPPGTALVAKPITTGPEGVGQYARTDDVQAKFKQQCAAAGPMDTLFIYITAHGLPAGGVKLDTPAIMKSGDPKMFEQVYPGTFNFNACMAGHVIVVIDSCYSGKMATGFDNILKKTGIPNYTVISATDATHESRGIPSWDPRAATGGYFTNQFISAFNAQVTANPTGTVDLNQAFQTAKTATTNSWFSGVPQQNPQMITGVGIPTPAAASTPAAGNPTPAAPAQPRQAAKPSLAEDLCARAKGLRDIAAKDRANAAAATNPKDKDYFNDDAKMMDGMAKEREDLARYYDPNACPEHAQTVPGGNSSPAQNQTGAQNGGVTPAFSTTPLVPGLGQWVQLVPGSPLWNMNDQRFYGSNPDGTPRADEQPKASSTGNSDQSSSATPAGETPGTGFHCVPAAPVAGSAGTDGMVDISQGFHCTGGGPFPPKSSFTYRLNVPGTPGKLDYNWHNGWQTSTIPGIQIDSRTFRYDVPDTPANTGSGNFDIKIDYSLKLTTDFTFRERLNTSLGSDISRSTWTAPITNGQFGAFTNPLPPYVNRAVNETYVNYLDQTTTATVPDFWGRGTFNTPVGNFAAFAPSTSPFAYQGYISATGALTLGATFRDTDLGGLSTTPGSAVLYTRGFIAGQGTPAAGETPSGLGSIPSLTPAIRRVYIDRPPYQLVRSDSYYNNGAQYFVIANPWSGLPYDCSFDFPYTLQAIPQVAFALAVAESHHSHGATATSRETEAHLQLASFRRNSPASESAGRAARTAQPTKPSPVPSPALEGPGSVPTLTYSIISNGKSTGEAFQLQVSDPTGKVKSVNMRDGTVLEAIKPGAAPPAAPAGGGAAVKQPLNGFCVQFHTQPPPEGALYRIAGQAVQQKYAPLRFMAGAAAQMSQAKQFHPDSDPSAYKNAILQYALWSKLEGWGQDQFTQNFIARTRENADSLHVSWTKQMEDALTAAAPGRWRDISEMMTQAQALEKASQGRAGERQARQQQ